MGNVFNPPDSFAELLQGCDERFSRDDWRTRIQAADLLNIVRREYAVATQEADVAIKFIKVAKQRAEDAVVALKKAKTRLWEAENTPELAEATRLLPIAVARHEESQRISKEAQAALKLMNRELRRLQQASMYATDTVVVAKRQEAAAERTTRQTALSFTREIVEKKEQAKLRAEETALVYRECKEAYERTVAPWERACDRLAEGTTQAIAYKEIVTARLEEAKHELLERTEDAEVAARTARSSAVAAIEPFGSLLLAITDTKLGEDGDRAKIEKGQRLMGAEQYAEAVVAFTEALEAEPPPQTDDAVLLLELRSTCYRSLSCFEDAKLDAGRAEELRTQAVAQAGGSADTVLAIIPAHEDEDAPAAPDPCLEAYVAVAIANLFDGITSTASDDKVIHGMLRIMRPCADACCDRRSRDWIMLGNGRRVRWLHAIQRAARHSISSETARKRLLQPQIISAASHIELISFVVAVYAVLRRGYQEQERKVGLMRRADLNYPTAEEITEAMEATAQETPVSIHLRDGRDPWLVAEEKLRERGQTMELREPPSELSDLHQAELSKEVGLLLFELGLGVGLLLLGVEQR